MVTPEKWRWTHLTRDGDKMTNVDGDKIAPDICNTHDLATEIGNKC